MKDRKYLVIVLVVVIIFGLGCVSNKSSKSGTDKENIPVTTISSIKTTTIVPTNTYSPTPIITSIQQLDRVVNVTSIIDGDTIYIDYKEKVRFVGINTPEVSESGYQEAKSYLEKRLKGKQIYLDVDDKNEKDKYGRTLAVVLIDGENLNKELLCKGYAEVMYIPPSEFDPYSWKNSCSPIETTVQTPTATPTPIYTSTPIQTSTPSASCDPSYPDFCIAPPPPDLDCGDIPRKNFKVLPPDPHKLDRDKDGIGCEI